MIINGTEVNIRQNPRARRFIIKIRHGEVDLVVPRRGSVKKAIRFYESKEYWVKSRLALEPAKIPLKIGAVLAVLGVSRTTTYGCMRGKSIITADSIVINGDPALAGGKIKKVVSEYLKAAISVVAEQKARELGVKFKRISIRDNVTRWGSCSSKGTLSFSWRIGFAPRFVMEYLACHEVAHLREMNHGRKFWQLVAELYPAYEVAEQWLKQNGGSLHLYQQ